MSAWIEHTQLIGPKFSDLFKVTKKVSDDEVSKFVLLICGGDTSKLFPFWGKMRTPLVDTLVLMPHNLDQWAQNFKKQPESIKAKALNYLVNVNDMAAGYAFCKTISAATECFFKARTDYQSKSELRFSNKSSETPALGTIYANDLPIGVSKWQEVTVNLGQTVTVTVKAVRMLRDREIY